MNGMMAAGASEAEVLIRLLDAEERFESSILCVRVDVFLRHITWLFFERGILDIESHTSAVIKWLERPHYYMIKEQGKVIGGGVLNATLDKCFSRLQSWVLLVKSVLTAEISEL